MESGSTPPRLRPDSPGEVPETSGRFALRDRKPGRVAADALHSTGMSRFPFQLCEKTSSRKQANPSKSSPNIWAASAISSSRSRWSSDIAGRFPLQLGQASIRAPSRRKASGSSCRMWSTLHGSPQQEQSKSIEKSGKWPGLQHGPGWSQYSSGSSTVVTLRSASVITQSRVPTLVW